MCFKTKHFIQVSHFFLVPPIKHQVDVPVFAITVQSQVKVLAVDIFNRQLEQQVDVCQKSNSDISISSNVYILTLEGNLFRIIISNIDLKQHCRDCR